MADCVVIRFGNTLQSKAGLAWKVGSEFEDESDVRDAVRQRPVVGILHGREECIETLSFAVKADVRFHSILVVRSDSKAVTDGWSYQNAIDQVNDSLSTTSFVEGRQNCIYCLRTKGWDQLSDTEARQLMQFLTSDQVKPSSNEVLTLLGFDFEIRRMTAWLGLDLMRKGLRNGSLSESQLRNVHQGIQNAAGEFRELADVINTVPQSVDDTDRTDSLIDAAMKKIRA